MTKQDRQWKSSSAAAPPNGCACTAAPEVASNPCTACSVPGHELVGEAVMYVVNALNRYFTSHAEAEAKIKAAREADLEGARGPCDIEDTATADDFVPPVLPDACD
jgi:hypothetical protein